MSRVFQTLAGACIAVLLASSPAAAQQDVLEPSPAEAPSEAMPDVPTGGEAQSDRVAAEASSSDEELVYVPPRRGHPRLRRGGGVRSAGIQLPEPLVLAPLDHIGLTTSEAPSLFWFVDGPAPANTRFEMTLIGSTAVEPLLQARLPTPEAAGIQRIDLRDHGVSLVEGVEYQWSVTLVVDPDDSSRDRVSIGGIARSRSAASSRTPRVLAATGLWYDALETLSDGIRANPDAINLRRMRGSLLRQGGLEDAVAAEP
jgi:hypothetical protein